MITDTLKDFSKPCSKIDTTWRRTHGGGNDNLLLDLSALYIL